MFIKIGNSIINTDLLRRVCLITERESGLNSPVNYYNLSFWFDNEHLIEWYFKKDEKELVDKEFNRIMEILLGKDNS